MSNHDIVLQATIHDEPVPLEWEVSLIDRERITIVVADRRDGTKYKVMRGRECLSIYGDWDFESMPSGRDDTYLDNHRFTQFSRAWELAKQASEAFIKEMQEKVDLMNAQRRKE